MPQLIAGAREPIPLETGAMGRLGSRGSGSSEAQESEKGAAGHGGRKYTSISYPGAGGADPGAGSAAFSSVRTATCESHLRIIPVNDLTSSGSNSFPDSSSR